MARPQVKPIDVKARRKAGLAVRISAQVRLASQCSALLNWIELGQLEENPAQSRIAIESLRETCDNWLALLDGAQEGAI